LPLLVLAFASRRWPRVTGTVLLALAIFAFFFFRLDRLFRGDSRAVIVTTLLLLPLFFSGIALLGAGRDE
jgi:uncharacterized membrane protein HdeD (DUF308 family)